MCSYASLGAVTKATVFYSLAGVVVGNALFKDNPSSLISKLGSVLNVLLRLELSIF